MYCIEVLYKLLNINKQINIVIEITNKCKNKNEVF